MKALARENMVYMVLTRATFQPETSDLNAVAPSNMAYMVLTRATFQPEMSDLNAVAPSNMASMLLTLAVFQAARSELKASAPENMRFMALTLATFQPERSELKAVALSNMEFMVLTRATFHLEMLWLHVAALLNMPAMVVTDTTFHLPMSALNVDFESNRSAMLRTAAVFHSPIGPYVLAAIVELVSQAVTAVLRLLSVRAGWPKEGGASTVRASSTSTVVVDIGRKEEGFDTICVPPNFRSPKCSVESSWTADLDSLLRSSSCSPAKIGSCSSGGMLSLSRIFAVTSSIASLDPTSSMTVSPVRGFTKICMAPRRMRSDSSSLFWICFVLTASIVLPDSTREVSSIKSSVRRT